MCFEVGEIALAVHVYSPLGSPPALCPCAAARSRGTGGFWLGHRVPTKSLNPASVLAGLGAGGGGGCEQATGVRGQALRPRGGEGLSVPRGRVSSMRCPRCPAARGGLSPTAPGGARGLVLGGGRGRAVGRLARRNRQVELTGWPKAGGEPGRRGRRRVGGGRRGARPGARCRARRGGGRGGGGAGRGPSPPAFEPGQSRGGERGRGRRQAVTSEPAERIRWESRRSGAERASQASAISGCRRSPAHRTAPQRSSGHHAEVPPGEGEHLFQTFLQVGAPARRDTCGPGRRAGAGSGGAGGSAGASLPPALGREGG